MKRLTGVVISNKMAKTAVVRVDRSFRHPTYSKIVRRSKNYLAHDETGVKVGEKVAIKESRPLSRRKRWIVVREVGSKK